jgi:hypothetical protein
MTGSGMAVAHSTDGRSSGVAIQLPGDIERRPVQQLVRLVTVLALVALARPALAQSPTALGIDSESVLVNKNLGAQQWAISRSFATRAVSGNVFEPGQVPQFVFCEQTAIVGSILHLACYGTGSCEDSPCADAWDPIANVELPASFFAVGPQGAAGLQGLLGRWRIYDYISEPVRELFTLEAIENQGGIPTIVGADGSGHQVLVQRSADVDPDTRPLYEFMATLDDGSLCRIYAFNRAGDGLRGRLQLFGANAGGSPQPAPADAGSCGSLLATYEIEGARLGHEMMVVPMAHQDDAATDHLVNAARVPVASTLVERLP